MPRAVKNKHVLPWNEGFKCFVSQTGETLTGYSWHYLKQVLGAYLDKKGLHVGDREAYLNECVCQAMEKDGRGGQCIQAFKGSKSQIATRAYEVDPRRPAGLSRGKPGYDGHAWASWHLSAWDGKLTRHYVDELIRRIGCGSCRSHALAYLAKHPFPAGVNRDAAYLWTWQFHNSVSKSIGKPEVSLEDSKTTWSLS